MTPAASRISIALILLKSGADTSVRSAFSARPLLPPAPGSIRASGSGARVWSKAASGAPPPSPVFSAPLPDISAFWPAANALSAPSPEKNSPSIGANAPIIPPVIAPRIKAEPRFLFLDLSNRAVLAIEAKPPARAQIPIPATTGRRPAVPSMLSPANPSDLTPHDTAPATAI